MIRELTRVDPKLEPLQEKIAQTLNPNSPARSLRVPLIEFLAKNLHYNDKSSPNDLAKGMQITGAIAPSHVLARRVAPTTKRSAALQKGLKARNSDAA